MMKNILFVIDYYLPHKGGIENVFENIILRLQKKGYKIVVLTSKYNKKLSSYEIKNNVKIYRIGKNRLGFILKSCFLAKKIFKENKIDTIHGSTYGGAIPAAIIAKKYNKKIILTVHEIFGKLWFFYKGYFLGSIYKLFEKIIFSLKYDIYHCVSNNTAKDLKRNYNINDNKIKVIHNGIDSDFWDNKKISKNEIKKWRKKYEWNNKFVCGYFGHAGKSKGIDYLIKALPKITEQKNTIVALNIIESKRTKKIIKKIEKIKNNNIKLYNGFSKENLRIFIASCNCIIAPSISEGFGSVHTETACMGIPLITTKTSAIPEVIFGKVKFIKTKSSIAIYNAIKDIKLQKYANISKKKFDWDKTTKEIKKLY